MSCVRLCLFLAFAVGGRELQAGPPKNVREPLSDVLFATTSKPGSITMPMTPRTLNLEQALSFTTTHNPEVAAERLAVRQAVARSRESRLYPDPVLSVEGEEYRRFFQPSEGLVTTMLRQTIPTGGKRGLAIGVAKGEVAIAENAFRRTLWSVLSRAKEAFYEALGARERLLVASKLVALAREFHGVVSQRVQGGVVAPLEGIRAQVLLEQARVEEARAEHTVEASCQALASLMGIEGSLPTTPVGDLTRRPPLPRFQELRNLGVSFAPEIEATRLKETVAKKELGRARALRIPDVELGVGVAHDGREPEEPRRYAASISFSLPLSNRSRYRSEAARAGVEQARKEQEASTRRLESDLTAELAQACRAQDQILAFERRVLPAARQAAELAGEGYRLGKMGYIDVIDAQRSLAQVSLDYVSALVEYHRALARVEGRVARNLLIDGRSIVAGENPHGKKESQ